MDGMELMRKARELDPELPVILMTAFAEVRGAVDAIRASAHDYLAKPFDHREVIRVVLRALNERRLKLELRALRKNLDSLPVLLGFFERGLPGSADRIGAWITPEPMLACA